MTEPQAEFTFEELWAEIESQSSVEVRKEGDIDREDIMKRKQIGACAAMNVMKKTAEHPNVQMLKVLDPETHRHLWVLRRISS